MKRYVMVGTGVRGITAYAIPIVQELGDCAKLCGVYDKNKKRAEVVSKMSGENIPVYDSFDEMLHEAKPDTVIVTTRDCDHDFYIVKALDAGCDVITEKPMTTDEDKCRAIFEAEKRSGKRVIVTFNVRFMPFIARVKEIMNEGVVGDVLSVHFEWMLDTMHGADYFRRWHRERKNSGSLLIHKSTHHFDVFNWLIEQDPVKVNAFGTRRFYGHTREQRSERCLTCPYKKTCEFYLDLSSNELLKELYLDCEDEDGYFRDKCIFSDEIDIEDSVCLNVKYNKGALMSYTLTTHSPYEGFRIHINGTNGRMEIENTSPRGVYENNPQNNVRIYNRKGEELSYNIPTSALTISTGHGGADGKMREMIFRDNSNDPLHQMADIRAGAMSIGIGIAANKSMLENRAVELSEFYGFLD